MHYTSQKVLALTLTGISFGSCSFESPKSSGHLASDIKSNHISTDNQFEEHAVEYISSSTIENYRQTFGVSNSNSNVRNLAVLSEFSQKIKPIIEKKCTRCHKPTGIAAHRPFKTSNDIAALGPLILYKIKNKSMPPWFLENDGECGDYSHDPTVTSIEFAKIETWLAEKTTRGVPNPFEANIKLKSPFETDFSTLDPDIASLKMREPYVPQPARGSSDEYRCFILDNPTDEDRFLTAYQVVPGEKKLVHHLILFALDSDADETKAFELDRQDARPGYSCLGNSGIESARPVVIWAPGQGVEHLPAGTGIKLSADRKFIVQIHYNNSSSLRVSDQTTVLIKTSSADSEIRPAKWLFSGSAAGEPMRKGQREVQRKFTYNLNSTGMMHGFFPHMHMFGTSLKTESESQCLGFAERWDFRWQLNYFLKSPINLSVGDTLTTTCTYDTTRASEDVKFGEKSGDEMCFGFIYFSESE